MKKKYMIGFFAVIFIFGALLTAGYQISYDHVTRQQAALDHEVTDTRSITAEGAAVEENGEDSEEGYYLCEMQGFVAVYLSDRQTIYELTEIPLTDLPGEVPAPDAPHGFYRRGVDLVRSAAACGDPPGHQGGRPAIRAHDARQRDRLCEGGTGI